MCTKKHSTPWKGWEGGGSRERLVLSYPILQTIPAAYSAAETWKPFLSLCWIWTGIMLQLQEQVCFSFGQPRCFWTKWLPKAMVVPKPCLFKAPLKESLFMLVSSGKHCTNTKRRPCDLFGSSAKAAGTLLSVVPFCNQAAFSLPNYWYSQIYNESSKKRGKRVKKEVLVMGTRHKKGAL